MARTVLLGIIVGLLFAPVANGQSTPQHKGHAIESSEDQYGVITRSRLLKNSETRDAFALFLVELLDRWGYDDSEKMVQGKINHNLIVDFADVLLKTSVINNVKRGNEHSVLLYSWFADTFFLLNVDGDGKVKIGAASASSISRKIFMNGEKEQYFDTILKERPKLFNSLVTHFNEIPNPELVFSFYTYSAEESLLIQENLVGSMKMLAWGSKDPCRNAAIKSVNLSVSNVAEAQISDKSKFYVNIGLWTPEGRVLGFADEATNRSYGFLIFNEDDTSACKPKATIFSKF